MVCLSEVEIENESHPVEATLHCFLSFIVFLHTCSYASKGQPCDIILYQNSCQDMYLKPIDPFPHPTPRLACELGAISPLPLAIFWEFGYDMFKQ